jgi:hypothetical protein
MILPYPYMASACVTHNNSKKKGFIFMYIDTYFMTSEAIEICIIIFPYGMEIKFRFLEKEVFSLSSGPESS